MKKNYAVGKEVSCYCGKCKLKLAHLIMSLHSPAEIAKVKCKTCHSEHRHSPDKPVSVKKSPHLTPKTKKELEQGVLDYDTLMASSNKVPTAYSIRSQFEKNDLINHPTFGTGIVVEVIDREKVQVLFKLSLKTLAHGK